MHLAAVPGPGRRAYKRGRRPPAGEFRVSRVQPSRRRSADRTVARTAPMGRCGTAPLLSVVSLGRHGDGPARVPSSTVTRAPPLIRGAPACPRPRARSSIPGASERPIKNGLIAGLFCRRGRHQEWSPSVESRERPVLFPAPGRRVRDFFRPPVNRSGGPPVLSVDGDSPRRRRTVARSRPQVGEAPRPMVAQGAHLWLPFPIDRARGWARGVRGTAGEGRGRRMRERDGRHGRRRAASGTSEIPS